MKSGEPDFLAERGGDSLFDTTHSKHEMCVVVVFPLVKYQRDVLNRHEHLEVKGETDAGRVRLNTRTDG